MGARYLNVDCILRSDRKLDDLVEFLDADVFYLWSESSEVGSYVGIETNLINTEDPEQDISEFIRLFDSLPPALLQLLNGCSERVFDIGFEVEGGVGVLDTRLSESVIGGIHKFGFSVGIRVYPSVSE